jgi:hypothetical protein
MPTSAASTRTTARSFVHTSFGCSYISASFFDAAAALCASRCVKAMAAGVLRQLWLPLDPRHRSCEGAL